MTSSGGRMLELITLKFHNIQEIVDIELMFELISMFIFIYSFLSSLQMTRKEETNNKTGESTKLLLHYYTVVKRMWTVAYFFISSSVIFRK